ARHDPNSDPRDNFAIRERRQRCALLAFAGIGWSLLFAFLFSHLLQFLRKDLAPFRAAALLEPGLSVQVRAERVDRSKTPPHRRGGHRWTTLPPCAVAQLYRQFPAGVAA